VTNIQRADLQKFHDSCYLPNESVLVVVGDFKMADMKEIIEKNFGSWKKGSLTSPELPAAPQQRGRHIYLVDRPGSVQSAVKLGNLAIQRSDPDYFPMLLANQILGGSSNSRLFANIREQKGYTYGAYSSFAPRIFPGEFAAEANVRNQ